ncbi:MAG: protein NosL [Candidatus Parabeggiatoa sp. nov. 3]|jgi:nitrous oxide reductase accessory protein NosL|nr:MAG: protein NosL [Gammaproteobacteria bacterium]RKZ69093.1 MAG: protein NosL [Gammaproteobacteria bacterium]RKZ80049.1 MAG: protein NosL [Gammaproteobacteria bacterium]
MFLWNNHCLKKRQHLIYLFSIIVLLTGCYNDNTGPTEIKWDRHTCERCRMVLSDKHFAVQVRGGPKNQVYLFDDLGCAVHWLNKQKWEANEIWIADYRNGEWLDARKAYYVAGQTTPMDFGFGAVAAPVSGSVDFETAKTAVLSKIHRHP